MKISYNWLKTYIQTDLTPQDMAAMLTNTGLEVEGVHPVEKIKGNLEGVVVGEVLTCIQHPNADRLRLTTVNIGADEPLHIVCGAPNVAAHQKVLVATVGTTLHFSNGESIKLKKGKIRGEVSDGMICAEDELGLGQSHDGIMVLDAAAVPGTSAASYLNLESDYMLEIGLTPNRTDAMSHFGVARDLRAALLHHNQEASLHLPSVEAFRTSAAPAPITVHIEDLEACPHYAGITIKGITVAPSPDWLQDRLKAIGITPKNNVVDVTNFILHEVGHPLHAFDADKIVGNQIIVKKLPATTTFVTLDEKQRALDAADLMICDTEKALCMAGVFGGLTSGISSSSTAVFIESAYFNPTGIRKTAKRHGLNTDASFRYERGIDPELTDYALKRAALLITELTGGQIVGDIQRAGNPHFAPFVFDVQPKRICSLIGAEIPEAKMVRILESLDIKVAAKDLQTWEVTVPPYRVDVTREADIAEEILRIYGLNNLPVSDKMSFSWIPNPKQKVERFRTRLTNLLNGMGFTEIMNNSLSKRAYYEHMGIADNGVDILNPLSQELNMMRQSLVPGFLETAAYNQNRKRPDLQLLEWGKVYGKNEAGFHERHILGLMVTGKDLPENWEKASSPYSFFYLKGVLHELFEKLHVTKTTTSVIESHPIFSDALVYSVKNQPIATIGRVADDWKKRFDMESEVFAVELDATLLYTLAGKHQTHFTPLPKYPAVRRDLALLVAEHVTYAQLETIAQKYGGKLLREINLFDVYKGKNLPEGTKSYAMSFVFMSEEKTLNEAQIEQMMARMQQALEQEAGASLRN
jgi:phenylalanyl-tRNA synthetase beta chain